MTSEQIAEYKRRLLAIPEDDRRRRREAAASQARLGNTLTPTEERAIEEQINRLRRDDPGINDNLSALADSYIRAGRPIAAEKLYKRVVQELDFKPSDYLKPPYYSPPYWSPPGRTSSLLVTILDLAYPELINLLIAGERYEEALEYAERSRSRHLQAVMQQKLAGGRIPDSFANMTVSQMRALAKETKSTFVVYTLTFYPQGDYLHRDRNKWGTATLFAWVIQPRGQIVFASLPIGSLLNSAAQFAENPVTESVNLFTRTIKRGVVDRVVERAPATSGQLPVGDREVILQRLYGILLQKLESSLPSDPEVNIVIVPANSICLVPFYALVGSDGKRLIERHTISLVPSLGIYALLQKNRSQLGIGRGDRHALVVGNPKMPALPGWLAQEMSLPQLPGAEKEAKVIAALLRTQPLIGEAASEEEVVKRIPGARVIHFATHGLLVNAAAETISFVSGSISADLPPGAIALAKRTAGASNYPNNADLPFNGFLASGKILTLALDADLVTLSACDTARGRLDSSQFVGLPSAFLAAGVRSIVMTLWSIPDAPTAELMVAFYNELLAGRSKSVALRRAMLTAKERYPDPQNWAAFTLIGLPD
jgi:CHAT domain-containing protein